MDDLELQNQEEQQQVEQPVEQEGTPQDTGDDKEPEFYLDDNGNLQWNTDEFEQKEEEDSEPQQEQEQPETTEQEEQEEETTVEEPKYKVKVDGEEVEVTQDELLRGYMRQRDYTQKTQQLAEQRRQFEQYRPQYQQPQQQVQQPVGDDLNVVAKRIAASRLGLNSVEDLSELDFDHITAVVEAKQALLNQQAYMMNRQRNINNLEAQLRSEEPKYDEIMANINSAIQNVPVSQYNRLKQAYADGNPEPLREFFKEMQKDYYSKVIKKVEDKKKPSVPVVEHSSNTPVQPTPKKNKVDFKKFGYMSSDEKAKVLIDMGFLD